MAQHLGLLTALLFLIHASAFTPLHPQPPPSSSLAATPSRRTFLTTSPLIPLLLPTVAFADDFESISARAAAVSAQVIAAEEASRADDERRAQIAKTLKEDTRNIYDFTLPVSGRDKSVAELVGGDSVKAILVVNIKQDDPLARKNIPELIALAERWVDFYVCRRFGSLPFDFDATFLHTDLNL